MLAPKCRKKICLDAVSDRSCEHHSLESGPKSSPDRNLSFLEDDLLPNPGFLTSRNNSLEDLLGKEHIWLEVWFVNKKKIIRY